MESFRQIHAFLALVRGRLLRHAATRALLFAATAVAAALLVLPLGAAWLREERSGALQSLGLFVVAATGLAVVALGWIAPRRRWRLDRTVAQHVGQQAPQVASDLLSSVELERDLVASPAFSPELAVALAEQTATRVGGLDVGALVPARDVRRAAQALAVAAVLQAVVALLAPDLVATGWRRLLMAPRSDGEVSTATLVSGPIVGDITLELTYPAYTRRAKLSVPASSGDITAPRGTEVAITTTALRAASRAFLRVDGEKGPGRPLQVEGRTLRGTLKLERPATYRFVLEPTDGEPVAEAEPHRIEIETDRAPRVELFAPADELEVSSQRRIELAYTVEDDYGIGEIALVWRGASGREERKILPPARPGSKNAQAKMLWDLSEITLEPGARIAYHIEAKDNDDVAGPNVGSSRTFYLRVFSPRERHEEILDREEQLFERAVSLLGDRLELGPTDDPSLADAHRKTQELVSEVSALIALVEKDRFSPKKLGPELGAMRERVDRLVRDERAAFEAAAPRGAAPALLSENRRVRALQPKHIAELEKDVLLLDDWLERQRIEEILAVSDEIKQSRERLKELLADFKRTHSEQTRAEIEREMRAIERRMAELQQKLASLRSETENRFVNSEALETKDSGDCMGRVRALIEKGDLAGADKELARCSKLMDEQTQAYEDALRDQRGDKFSEEEKALGELMSEVADLEADQSEVAEKAEGLLDDYKKRAAQLAREQANPAREEAKKTVDKLKKELAGVPRGALTPFGQEEFDYLSRRVDDMAKMLDEKDAAEALAMARQAETSLKVLEAEIEDDLEDGKPWSDRTAEALERTAAADPLVQEIIKQLEQAMPSPQQIMSPSEKQALEQLGRRQQGLEERARRLKQRAQKKAKEMPGRAGEEAQSGLDEAGQHMGRAEGRFGKNDPLGGRDEARQAADRLGKLKEGMRRASRPSVVEGGGGQGDDNEPVRIPGREEYKAPEEFREDILDAMKKERPPDAYRDQVKRYYEELVK